MCKFLLFLGESSFDMTNTSGYKSQKLSLIIDNYKGERVE